MNDIKVVHDILPPNLITALKLVVHSRKNEFKWKTNLGRQSVLQRKSSQVAIFNLSDTDFHSTLIKIYEKHIGTKDCIFNMTYCIWHNGSYIPFHVDSYNDVYYGSTIYLNDNWDKNYGGLYIYEDKDTLKAICPKYNLGIINSSKLLHATSIISNDAPLRETIQFFITKKND